MILNSISIRSAYLHLVSDRFSVSTFLSFEIEQKEHNFFIFSFLASFSNVPLPRSERCNAFAAALKSVLMSSESIA